MTENPYVCVLCDSKYLLRAEITMANGRGVCRRCARLVTHALLNLVFDDAEKAHDHGTD